MFLLVLLTCGGTVGKCWERSSTSSWGSSTARALRRLCGAAGLCANDSGSFRELHEAEEGEEEQEGEESTKEESGSDKKDDSSDETDEK